jgi:hypothetical protein
MGSSQGGIVALKFASTHAVSHFAISDELKFKAARGLPLPVSCISLPCFRKVNRLALLATCRLFAAF